MLNHFHVDFKSAAEKFDGFIDLKMVKLRKVVQEVPRRNRKSIIVFNLRTRAKRKGKNGLLRRHTNKCGRWWRTPC